MSKTRSNITSMSVLVFTILLACNTAHAKIRCDGQFQVNSGNRIATPYCEDAYLAQVARSYGSHISAETIRQSPTAKERICAFVGSDIRVSDICSGYRPEDHRR